MELQQLLITIGVVTTVPLVIWYYINVYKPKQEMRKKWMGMTEAQLKRTVADSIYSKNLDKVKNLISFLEQRYPEFHFDFVTHRADSTTLSLAAHVGNLATLQYFIDKGGNVNSRDFNGNTPLHWAARMGKEKHVRLLLQHKADQTLRNDENTLPIHWAAMNGRLEIVQHMLQFGDQSSLVNSTDPNGMTCVHFAANNGHSATLQLLLNSGGILEAKDDYQETPIHKSCNNGSIKSTSVLLSFGASIKVRNALGQSPVFKAVRRGHKTLISMLMEHDANFVLKELISMFTAPESEMPSAKFQEVLQFVSQNAEYRKQLLVEAVRAVESSGMKILDQVYQPSASENPSVLRQHFLANVRYFKILSPEETHNFELWTTLDRTFTSIDPLSIDNVRKTLLCSSLEGYASLSISKELISFVERHLKVLRKLVEIDPLLLLGYLDFMITDAHLSSHFLDVARSISFENKQTWFRDKLSWEQALGNFPGTSIVVPRKDILFGSCASEIGTLPPSALKGEINVRFEGEYGVGAGIKREWFRILTNEMFNPDNALFNQCANNTFQPNAKSYINPDHLSYFHFVGRVIGLALYHNELLDVHFTNSFYKHILNMKIQLEDMQSIDPDYYRNLQFILTNPIDEDLDLVFTSQIDMFGKIETVELKPNGAEIAVTDENKDQYVQLVTELRMIKSIEQQTFAFLEGFHEMIPKEMISIFSECELELLISGLPDIDVNDWQMNTTYTNGYSETSPIITWFWQIVQELNQEEKTKLLQYVSGTSKVPIGGFKNLKGLYGPQKFSIAKAPEVTQLPHASTCFNMLKLPEYESADVLKRNIMIVIQHGTAGFGFQ